MARRKSDNSQPTSRTVGSNTPSITLCMITKNEESMLPECIESVKGLVNQIVVVDTGSTDSTRSVAKAMGAEVFRFKWTGSFSDARNEALSHATSKWVLILDADERLDASSRNAVLSAVNSKADAYLTTIINYTSDDEVPDVFVHRVCRLFRNDPHFRFRNRIHEEVETAVRSRGGTILESQALIHHLGYRPDIVQDKGKIERNIKLLHEELKSKPGDPYMLYHLGLTYSDVDREKAVSYMREASHAVKPGQFSIAPMIYSRLASLLSYYGRETEAIEALQEAYSREIRHPELSYRLGKSLLSMQRPLEAISHFEIAIREGQTRAWSGDWSTFGYMAFFQMGAAYLALNDHRQAAACLEEGLNLKKTHRHAREVLASVYTSLCRMDRAEEQYLELIRLFPQDAKNARMALIELYANQGRLREATVQAQQLLEDGFDSPELQNVLNVCKDQNAAADAAEDFYLKAIDLDSTCVSAYVQLADLYAAQGRLADALDMYSRAAELDPSNAAVFFNAAECLLHAGMPQQAVPVFENGLLAKPDHAPGYVGLGNCYYQLGSPEAAAVAYRKALQIDPGLESATSNLRTAEAETYRGKAA